MCFFFKQKTAYDMRISDWSSDVCSSDLYITGNHDEFLRRYVDHALHFGNISIANEAIHHTADGRRLLVLHGDAFDMITRYFRRIAIAGDAAYHGLMRANVVINHVRARFDKPQWSLDRKSTRLNSSH